MQKLSNDDLGHCLAFLTSKEKLVLTRVCKTWYFCTYTTQTVMDINVLHFKKRKTLDIEKMFEALKRFNTLYKLNIENCQQLNDSHMKTMIQLYGTALRELHVAAAHDLTSLQAHECNKLKCLILDKNPNLVHLRVPASLEKLDMSRSYILDSNVTSVLQATPKLKQLALASCKNIANPQFPMLPCLIRLDISNTKIYREALEALLAQLPNLKQLKADTCHQLKSLHINSMPEIQSISLAHCRNLYNLTMDTCEQLKHLDLSKTPVESKGIAKFWLNNTQIETLLLQQDHKIEAIIDLKNTMLDVKELDLGFTSCTDGMLNTILKLSPKMDILHLGCTHVVNPQIALKNLRLLDVSDSSISQASAEYMLQQCPQLVFLSLQLCDNIENITIAHAQLQTLVLSATRVSPEVVQHIVAQCGKLQYLDISGCNNITHLALASPTLQTIIMDRCAKMAQFNLKCPLLETISCIASVNCKIDPTALYASCPRLSTITVDFYFAPQYIMSAIPEHITWKKETQSASIRRDHAILVQSKRKMLHP